MTKAEIRLLSVSFLSSLKKSFLNPKIASSSPT